MKGEKEEGLLRNFIFKAHSPQKLQRYGATQRD